MPHIVYIATCTINSKVYIGMTGDPLHVRWREHVRDAMAGSQQVFHNAIRKYGEEAFRVNVLTTCATRREAGLTEEGYVALYHATDRERGYNVDPGGTAHGLSPEARAKMGAKRRAAWASMGPEERAVATAKLASARATRTDETWQKISATLKERNAALAAGRLQEWELERRATRLADAEPNYGQVRSYKPKPPRTKEQRAESARKAAPRQSVKIRKTLAAKPAEVKRAEKLKSWNTRRASDATLTPEQRDEKRRNRKPRDQTPEEAAAAVKLGWDKRRENIAAACPPPSLRFNLMEPRLPATSAASQQPPFRDAA